MAKTIPGGPRPPFDGESVTARTIRAGWETPKQATIAAETVAKMLADLSPAKRARLRMDAAHLGIGGWFDAMLSADGMNVVLAQKNGAAIVRIAEKLIRPHLTAAARKLAR